MRRCIKCNKIIENHEIICSNCFIKQLEENKKIIENATKNIIQS